jgi:unsaturated rhamnogalacturonyl hydrolase
LNLRMNTGVNPDARCLWMRLCLVVSVLCFFASPAFTADTRPSFRRAEVVDLMEKVCDYQIAHPWPFANDKNKDWERSTFYIGVMATYRTTRASRFLNQALKWSRDNHWAIDSTTGVHADEMTAGQVYLDLYFLKPDPKRIDGLRKYADREVANGERGRVIWDYIDALFVAPPALAGLAAATGEQKYLDYMNWMFWDVADLLYDRKAGLFYRDKSYNPKRAKNGKKVFWSRGNGWVIGGIPLILQYLPKNNPRRGQYISLLQTMASSIARLQQPDGLWRTSLLDPKEFPAPETSGTSFFCYAMAWGINHGLLPRKQYLPVVERAWNGLANSVHSDGKLGWVQEPNKEPGLVTTEDTQEYGVGAFLLAGSEVARLAR